MSNNNKSQLQGLGLILEKQRKYTGFWRFMMIFILVVIVLLNLVLKNYHPHFDWDRLPGAWAVFGLGVGIIMVFTAKKIIQPLIKRREDFYGDV